MPLVCEDRRRCRESPPAFTYNDTKKFPLQLCLSREKLADVGGVGLLNQFEVTKLLAGANGWSSWKLHELAWQQGSLSNHTVLEEVRELFAEQERASGSGDAVPRARRDAEDVDFSFFDAGFLNGGVDAGEAAAASHVSRPKKDATDFLAEDGNDSDFANLSDDCDAAEDDFDELPEPRVREVRPKPPDSKAPGPAKPRAARVKSTDNDLIAQALGDRFRVRRFLLHPLKGIRIQVKRV